MQRTRFVVRLSLKERWRIAQMRAPQNGLGSFDNLTLYKELARQTQVVDYEYSVIRQLDARFLTWLIGFIRLFGCNREQYEKTCTKIVDDLKTTSYHMAGIHQGMLNLQGIHLYCCTKVLGLSDASFPMGFEKAIAERLIRYRVAHDLASVAGVDPFFCLNSERIKHYAEMGCLDTVLIGTPLVLSRCRQSVLHIEVGNKDGNSFGGTGFVLRNEGNGRQLITNQHVVDPKKWEIKKIVSADGVEYGHKLNRVSKDYDLAIVDLEDAHNIPGLHVLTGNSYPLQTVIAIGFPFIARVNRADIVVQSGQIIGSTKTYDGEELMLISIPIMPGSSGGPIVNELGLVVGVSTQSNEGEYQVGRSIHYAAISSENLVEFLTSSS